MPHYANGREAKLGDEVIGTGHSSTRPFTGVVVCITPGPGTCNLQVMHAWWQPNYGSGNALAYPTLLAEIGDAGKFLHLDDLKTESRDLLERVLGLTPVATS